MSYLLPPVEYDELDELRKKYGPPETPVSRPDDMDALRRKYGNPAITTPRSDVSTSYMSCVYPWRAFSPNDAADTLYKKCGGMAVLKLQSEIDSMEGHDFENWCANLLHGCGFGSVEVTRGSGDQGADVIGFYRGERWAVQCKNYSAPVGNNAVQQVFSGARYYGCSRHAVMTNQTFTASAVELAVKTGTELIGRDELLSMLAYKAARI